MNGAIYLELQLVLCQNKSLMLQFAVHFCECDTIFEIKVNEKSLAKLKEKQYEIGKIFAMQLKSKT